MPPEGSRRVRFGVVPARGVRSLGRYRRHHARRRRRSDAEPLRRPSLGLMVPEVEGHVSGSVQLAWMPTPAGRVPSLRGRVDVTACEQDADVVAAVAFVRRDETDGAVSMLAIVPLDEALDPRPRGVDRREGFAWVRGDVLQRAE